MRKILSAIAAAVLLCGCASATRLSITQGESHSQFVVQHHDPQAFSKVEVALAEMYNDLPRVLKLKQQELGVFVLKPNVDYNVSIAPQTASYTLKISVTENKVTLEFDLGREIHEDTWAPKTQIPKIKAEFRRIAAGVARAVGGTLG